MRDMEAHAVTRVSREMNGNDFTVAHGKHVLFGQRLSKGTRHVLIVAIGPRGEKIPRFEGRLTVAVDVHRDVAKGSRDVGGPARHRESARGQQDAIERSLPKLSRDALHLEGLVPRRPCVDEQVS